ncbi:hypothetical protein CVD28_15610 [Bacillus sp. M6-12]|uniref:hypothetical protein n=1 Tax=Bacillus sp. M6-12 TaxID=2054166 RepID=UPI000C785F3F|nr:hypothetical protein [Bacillus sp. M6-12]PLS16511.1 hypothetical protein CVD28_15610 [Bacillus sp. M6-12]
MKSNKLDRKLASMPLPELNNQKRNEMYHLLEKENSKEISSRRKGDVKRSVIGVFAAAAALGLFLLLSVTAIKDTQIQQKQGEITQQTDLNESFKINGETFYGIKNKFAIRKMNGSNDPEFPAGSRGGHYVTYFWGEKDALIGKKYKMIATHEVTGESAQLYEWEIASNMNPLINADAQSGAKFGFDKEGRYRIDVTVSQQKFASFTVHAELVKESPKQQ